jgi:hypothetical protein
VDGTITTLAYASPGWMSFRGGAAPRAPIGLRCLVVAPGYYNQPTRRSPVPAHDAIAGDPDIFEARQLLVHRGPENRHHSAGQGRTLCD